MISVIKMERIHAETVLNQQTVVKRFLTDEYIDVLIKAEHSYAAISPSGKVLGIGGLVKQWENRYEAWAVLDEENPFNFLLVHRCVKRFLSVFPARRIEATVDCGFGAGFRWIESLGFELECDRMRAYGPDGNDCALYSKVREDM